MGRRTDRARTPGLWIATNALPATGGHPFYQRLNRILDRHDFNAFVEAQCTPFFSSGTKIREAIRIALKSIRSTGSPLPDHPRSFRPIQRRPCYSLSPAGHYKRFHCHYFGLRRPCGTWCGRDAVRLSYDDRQLPARLNDVWTVRRSRARRVGKLSSVRRRRDPYSGRAARRPADRSAARQRRAE